MANGTYHVVVRPEPVINLNPALDDRDFATEFGGNTLESEFQSGGSTNALPIEITVREPDPADGTYSGMFGGRYFDRIHLIPPTLELGDVLSDVTQEIELWNAYRWLAKTLTSFTVTGTAGTTLDDPYGTPIEFKALQSRIYEVTVAKSGDSEVSSSLIPVFTGVESPVVIISGSRTTVFVFEPNWVDGIRDTHQWLTNVISARSGKEQRRRMRLTPRRRLQYTVDLDVPREQQMLESFLWRRLGTAVSVPLWMNAVYLEADVALGALTLTVEDVSELEFAAEDTILLYRDPFDWWTVKLDAVAPTLLTLAFETTAAWPKRLTRVVPLRRGWLIPTQTIERENNEFGHFEVDFALETA